MVGEEAVLGCEATVTHVTSEEVMSEVHLGCPPRFSENYFSRFTFSLSTSKPTEESPDSDEDGEKPSSAAADGSTNGRPLCLDNDGDLVLTRRTKRCVDFKITVRHRITSSIPHVGLQIWKASMVLADFVLHTSVTSADFNGVTAVELGAGTGLVGILLARAAKKVYLTDYDVEILENCYANVQQNSSLFKFPEVEHSVHVRKLDWTEPWPPLISDLHGQESSDRSKFLWSSSEVEEVESTSLILAADVIYSDELTNSLFKVLEVLMSRGCEKVLYLAMEKRYNFCLSDLDIVANGYSHFRSFFRKEGDCGVKGKNFVGRQIDIAEIPQYMRDYDRGTDLELWRISYTR